MECPACNKAVRPNGLSIPAASSKYTCASCGAHNSHAPNAQAEGTDEKQWEEYEFEATAWNADGKVLEARCRVCPTVYKSRFLAALLDAHRKTPSHKLRAAKGSQTANESDDPQDDVDETQNSTNYVPFITPAQRKRQRQEKFESGSHALKKAKEENTNKEQDTSDGEGKQATFAERDITSYQPDRSVALLDVSHEINKNAEADPEYAKWLKQEDERKVLETITVQQKTLKSAKELADGIEYTESIVTGWTAPRHIRNQGKEAHDRMRKKWHILVEGEDVPPPIKSFKDMRFPKGVMEALAAKGIKRPTPIQVQGLPVALSGRDMIGIAFTGSGKTMTFTLPMVMVALGEELKLPLVGNEGPFGLILGPSRELQRQTYEVVQHFTSYLQKAGFPELRCTLAIGGEDKRPQLDLYWRKGVHMIVATPGRLNDFLKQKKINLESCKYICLDEGDRMMDLGFDEEVQHTLGYFKGQRQMLLFSATMPKKFVDFAKTALVRPVTVNVGRAGAANLDVIQEVEYVKQEAKIVYLLQCLQKTAPPVLIFCERKQDVDDIHEYLLLKGVEAVAIHGGKDQADRNWAIDQFKLGRKDVLVATDIAAKGLDFPAIQHVINFDMPEEIENYVHRIGRTGRGGRTGVATTFINKGVELHALMDLKHLLKEAKQRIPPALMMYPDPTDEQGGSGDEGDELGKGCSYCGGLGHRITSCPKLQGVAKSQQAGMRDIVGGAAYSGDW